MRFWFRIVFLAVCLLPFSAQALDPIAPISERKFGIIYVKTPQPGSDMVTVIPVGGGKSMKVASEKEVKVPVGNYEVTVQMQEYQYQNQVAVTGTERTEVIVPGYGNLKVTAPKDASIEVFKSGTQSLVAKFPPSKLKVLPAGYYDVQISLGGSSVMSNDVWIVTNTTREVEASFSKKN
ncbi:MAG TPA: hypothetical protein DF383_02720 [Deltaproteobacteria bacterium]|nr:hypothetical protein [Deltaproteobacteria bacterium]